MLGRRFAGVGKTMSDVIVIGAGITGVTTAYYLAKQGYRVIVLEKESQAGMLTSYANGGQLSVSNSEVWNTWTNVWHGLQWMFNSSAPFRVGFPTPAKTVWLSKFLYHTAVGSYYKNTIKTIEMAMASQICYDKIRFYEKIKYDYSQKGILHFYTDEKTFEKSKQATHLYYTMGVNKEIINPQQVVEIEPTLEKFADTIVGGTYTKLDGMGDMHKFCVNLAEVCRQKYFVKFVYNADVQGITYKFSDYHQANLSDQVYRAKHIVICAGVYSNNLLSESHWVDDQSDNIGIYPVKGYSITIPKGQGTLPKVSLTDDKLKIVSTTLGDRLRVAGTAELAGWNLSINKRRIDPLMSWSQKYFPDLDYENAVPWAGLRPMTPSMMPVVRQHNLYKNIWFNTGHGHLGWTLGAYTAKQISNQIVQSS